MKKGGAKLYRHGRKSTTSVNFLDLNKVKKLGHFAEMLNHQYNNHRWYYRC
jgi:hypothetical protein